MQSVLWQIMLTSCFLLCSYITVTWAEKLPPYVRGKDYLLDYSKGRDLNFSRKLFFVVFILGKFLTV